MGRLARVNRLALVAVTVGLVAVAVRAPTAGPLASLPGARARYAALAGAWLAATALFLVWQRTLWTTMGEGAGFSTGHGVGPVLRLAPMQGTVRGRTVTVEAVRPGWSPWVRLRISAPFEADPPAQFSLAVTTERDPDGRVLFEAPDADRRYVLRSGDGDIAALLPTEFRAELADVATPGTLAVGDNYVTYETAHLPFDAGCLRTCARTAVRLAERVESTAGGRRGGTG